MSCHFGLHACRPANADAGENPPLKKYILGYDPHLPRGILMPSDYGDQETKPLSRGPAREHVPEHNEVIQRRAIAAGVIVLFLIVVLLLARGCAS
jgi:hypothetical protein